MSFENYDIEIEEIVLAGVRSGQARIMTQCPGKVTKYDAATQTCSVQPMVKQPVYDPQTQQQYDSETMPELQNVPVGFFRGGGFQISFPLNVGDEVTIEWQMLATGQWRTSGQLSESLDTRRHSIGSAIVRPDAFSVANALKDPATYPGTMVLSIDGDPDSSIRISNGTVVCGGATPAPLAMAIQTANAVTSLQAQLTEIEAVVALLGTALGTYGALTGGGFSDSPPGTAQNAAISACNGLNALVVPEIESVTSAIPDIPSTITKGQ